MGRVGESGVGKMETTVFGINKKMFKEVLKKNIIHRKNLTKDVKVPYMENYKILKNKIEDTNIPWKPIPCSWIGRINIIKVSILHKAMYRFDAIPTKVPMISQNHSQQ